MKYVYPAIFTPAKEGYQIQVPDLPGCITYGTDIADALAMVQDAVEMCRTAENRQQQIHQSCICRY